jgi:outer membrane autotransporter protein
MYQKKSPLSKKPLRKLLLSSLILAPSQGFAVENTLTSESEEAYYFSSTNETLNINSGGNINSMDDGISVGSRGLLRDNWKININADEGKGVYSKYQAAIVMSSASYGEINLNSGTISSDATSSFSNYYNAISLFSYSNKTDVNYKINTAKNTLITSNKQTAISSIFGKLTVSNAGTISGNYGIFSQGSGLDVTNSGTIIGTAAAIDSKSSGVSPDAINLITNTGLIRGNITMHDVKASITNSGLIEGNINSSTGKLTISNNENSEGLESKITGNIDLGTNSESSLTLNGGSIIGNVTVRNDSQEVNLGEGSYNGEIDGAASSLGTVNITKKFTLKSPSAIGSTNGVNTLNINNGSNLIANGSSNVNNLNILSGGVLTLGSDNIFATNTSVAGTLDFGNSNRSFNSNVLGSGSGTFNIGSASHTVNGDLTINSGDTIAVTLLESEAIGSIKASGAATVASGAKIAVGLESAYRYIKDGSSYKIVSGESGSDITAVTNDNINVNKSGSNKAFQVLTFTSSASGNDLYLNASRLSAAEITDNKNSQKIYTLINKIGDSATGELKEFQKYIDTSSSSTQIEKAIESASPQNDGGIQRNSVTIVNNSVHTTEKRLDIIRISSLNPAPSSTTNGMITENDSKTIGGGLNSSGISSGDKEIDQGIWGQVFGSVAKQNSSSQDGGFRSTSSGVAFGYDKEISKGSHLGIAISYANSKVKSTDSLKQTDVDTYQANIYNGKTFGKYFLDTIVGFAWNDYNSNRAIPSINKTAESNYQGQSYISKARTGFIQDIGHGFNLIPELSLSFVHNRNNNYSETGAGSMNLDVQGSSTNFLEGRGGLKLGYHTITKEGTKITPEIRVSYGYDFIGDRQTITSNFAGQTATFSSLSSKVDQRSFRAGAGIDFANINEITLSADYNYERKSEYYSHSGSLKARYSF